MSRRPNDVQQRAGPSSNIDNNQSEVSPAIENVWPREKEAKKHGSQLIDQTRGRKQIIWLSLANSRCVTKESVAIHMSKTGQECANVACGPHNLSGQCAYLKRFVDVSSNLRNFFCTHFTPGVKTWLEIYS